MILGIGFLTAMNFSCFISEFLRIFLMGSVLNVTIGLSEGCCCTKDVASIVEAVIISIYGCMVGM